MPDIHLGQAGFTYSASGPFTKHREGSQKFTETGNLREIYKNELDKTCFSHDAAYSDSKYLAKRTNSIWDKILKDKVYQIATNSKYDRYQRGVASIVYKFFDKETGAGMSVNEELGQELHKPVIKKTKSRKVYSRFKDNIWEADLPDMGSFSSSNRSIKYLLCVIDVSIKYAWVKPLKEK